jgi:hypothetical protein
MHKNATKCNKTQSKWCKNKHGASKIIDTFETYHVPIVVHFHLIWRSASRLFAEDHFMKLTPIHELGELQRNALLLTVLSTSNAEEGIDFGRRRRRSIARSNARA